MVHHRIQRVAGAAHTFVENNADRAGCHQILVCGSFVRCEWLLDDVEAQFAERGKVGNVVDPVRAVRVAEDENRVGDRRAQFADQFGRVQSRADFHLQAAVAIGHRVLRVGDRGIERRARTDVADRCTRGGDTFGRCTEH